MKNTIDENKPNPLPNPRPVRFAPKSKASKAGKWALKKYANVFRKLAQ